MRFSTQHAGQTPRLYDLSDQPAGHTGFAVQVAHTTESSADTYETMQSGAHQGATVLAPCAPGQRSEAYQLEQALDAISSRPAPEFANLETTAELLRICCTFGYERVVSAIVVPRYVGLAVLILPSLACGSYGELEVFHWPAGGKHIGRCRDGEVHGFGVFLQPDGCIVSGHFEGGTVTGSVVMCMPDGTELTGEIRDGNWHGEVTEKKPDGTRRCGVILDGQFEGRMSELDAQGQLTRYTLRGGLIEGKWIRYHSDGSREICMMVAGRKQGPYQHISSDSRIEGTMVDGLLEGVARRIGPGLQYTIGQIKAGRFMGMIKRRFPNGELYRGEAIDGVPHGRGVALILSGDKYEGNFHRGGLFGHGTMTHRSGDKKTGTWSFRRIEGDYKYETAAGTQMGYKRISPNRAIVNEIRPPIARPIRYAQQSLRHGASLLHDRMWQAMLVHHDEQVKKLPSPARKTELCDPWLDWQPQKPAITAIAGIFEHVTAANFVGQPATHQFLLGLMHLLGPAQDYTLFKAGAFQIDFNVFGHYPNQASFIAQTMPIDTGSHLEIVLRKGVDVNDNVSMFFHQEHYQNPRAAFVSSFEYLAAGLERAWQRDTSKEDLDYTASNAVLTHLLDHGPCLEARATSMTLTLQGLELIDDVARNIPDLAGKDTFEQSNEILRIFRDQAIERFAQAYNLDSKDTRAIEADARFTQNFFNATFFRAFLSTFDHFKVLSSEQVDAVIAYQTDTIGVLEA